MAARDWGRGEWGVTVFRVWSYSLRWQTVMMVGQHCECTPCYLTTYWNSLKCSILWYVYFSRIIFKKRNTVVSNFLTISATGKALVSMSRQKNKFARGHIKKKSFQAEVRQGRKTTLPKSWSNFHFLLLLPLMFSIFLNCYISGFSNVRGRSFLPMQNLPEPCRQIIHWTIMPLTFIYVTDEQHVL